MVTLRTTLYEYQVQLEAKKMPGLRTHGNYLYIMYVWQNKRGGRLFTIVSVKKYY